MLGEIRQGIGNVRDFFNIPIVISLLRGGHFITGIKDGSHFSIFEGRAFEDGTVGSIFVGQRGQGLFLGQRDQRASFGTTGPS